MKILIAEDNQVLLKMLATFLEMKGYQITKVENGLEAIEIARNEHFDLIVTDLNMPFASGMEVVGAIRNELNLQTPIIMLTSESIETTELDAFHLGASEFITKPFSLPTFALRVEKLLSLTHK